MTRGQGLFSKNTWYKLQLCAVSRLFRSNIKCFTINCPSAAIGPVISSAFRRQMQSDTLKVPLPTFDVAFHLKAAA